MYCSCQNLSKNCKTKNKYERGYLGNCQGLRIWVSDLDFLGLYKQPKPVALEPFARKKL